MPAPKPIETEYQGYRFRSRLEARWAVFLDALGLEWVYEPQGFELGDGLRYLPDFKTALGWIEVKGGELSERDDGKLRALAAATDVPVWLGQGLPGFGPPYHALDRWGPDGRAHPLPFWFHRCPRCQTWSLTPDGTAHPEFMRCDCLKEFGSLVLRASDLADELDLHPASVDLVNVLYGMNAFDETEQATKAAKSARFEFGESGAPSVAPTEGEE